MLLPKMAKKLTKCEIEHRIPELNLSDVIFEVEKKETKK